MASGGECFKDEVRGRMGMWDQRQVARLDLDRLRTHSLGHETLQAGIELHNAQSLKSSENFQISGRTSVDYFRALATRKPMLLMLKSGGDPVRFADRMTDRTLNHEPPR